MFLRNKMAARRQNGCVRCLSLLVVFQSFFGVPNHCSLHSSLSFSLDSGVDCAAQISNGRKTKEMGLLEFEGHSRFRGGRVKREAETRGSKGRNLRV